MCYDLLHFISHASARADIVVPIGVSGVRGGAKAEPLQARQARGDAQNEETDPNAPHEHEEQRLVAYVFASHGEHKPNASRHATPRHVTSRYVKRSPWVSATTRGEICCFFFAVCFAHKNPRAQRKFAQTHAACAMMKAKAKAKAKEKPKAHPPAPIVGALHMPLPPAPMQVPPRKKRARLGLTKQEHRARNTAAVRAWRDAKKRELERLRSEHAKLTEGNASLRQANVGLSKENAGLRQENEGLRRAIAHLLTKA